MTGATLRAELLAAETALWQPVAMRWFKARGFPVRDLLDHAPGVGLARVEIERGGFYQPHDSGRPAVIVAVWRVPPVEFPTWRSEGALIDLGAIVLSDGAVLLRRGVGIALGEHRLGTDERPARLPCYLDGVAWLRAGGDGIVAVDWDAVAREAAGVDLLFDSVAAGEEAERRLAETLPRMPRVLVAAGRAAA